MRDVGAALGVLPAVFDLGDASSAGVTARVLERAVRGGLVHRLSRGLFTPTAVWRAAEARQRHLLLATAAARRFPTLTLSHHTAALVHGLPSPLRLPDWVALTSDRSDNTCPSGRLSPGWSRRRSRRRTSSRGGGCVSPSPTARWSTVFAACRYRTPSPSVMRHYGDASSPGSGWSPCAGSRPAGPGCAPSTSAPACSTRPARRGSSPGRSPSCGSWGSRSPLRRWPSTTPGARFVGRVDGLWREGGTVVEADGAGKYLGEFDADGPSGLAAARAVVAEKVREDRLRSCGLEVVRSDVPGCAAAAGRRGEGARRPRTRRSRALHRPPGAEPVVARALVHPIPRAGCPGCSETTDSGPLRPSMGC